MMSLRRLAHVCRPLAVLLLLTACGGGTDEAPAPPTNLPTPSGTLTVTGCTIDAESTACDARIQWSSANARSPRLLVAGATVSSAAGGDERASVPAGPVAITLLDGATTLAERVLSVRCAAASAWNGARCQTFARRRIERAPTPFVESGQAVTLEVVFYLPLADGRYPTLVFHHGSTGDGSDPSRFTVTYVNEHIAQFFTTRGWAVVFPQRRGRGGSDGLYDEGFTADRSGYSCQRAAALQGLGRALEDADAIDAFLAGHPVVESTTLVVGGESRGGILALAQAGRHPDRFEGALNFVGGWLGEGCVDAVAVNRPTFAGAAAFTGTTLWLYGENDSFYSLAHSGANFDAFVAAGGRGSYLSYRRAPALNGHFIAEDPSLWSGDLATWLETVGSP